MGPCCVGKKGTEHRLQVPGWLLTQPQLWLGGVLVFSVILVFAALVLEHGFGVTPCQMCWWQRYVHMALAGVAATGVLLPRYAKLWGFMLAALAMVGVYIATWQSGAQLGWWSFPPSCTGWGQTLANDAADMLAAMARTKVVPCDKEQFRLFGLTLAMWNIPAMLAVFGVSLLGVQHSR